MKFNNLLLVFLVLITATQNFAQTPVYQVSGDAINGYDAVAYFEQKEALSGKEEFAYSWNNARWKFSSQDNLERFIQNPEKYAPQYGGYCAYGASRGYLAQTDPLAFTILDERLYLNYNKDVRTEWMKDVKERIRKADLNWEKKLKLNSK